MDERLAKEEEKKKRMNERRGNRQVTRHGTTSVDEAEIEKALMKPSKNLDPYE